MPVRRIGPDGRVRTSPGPGFEEDILARGTRKDALTEAPALPVNLNRPFAIGFSPVGSLSSRIPAVRSCVAYRRKRVDLVIPASSLRRILSLAPPIVIAVVLGCSGSTDPPPPPDCTGLADTSQAATVSYQNDIVPFYADASYGCTAIGCHGEGFPGSDYSLATYDEMFDQGSQARARGLCSVRPGAPDESYLIWKIEGRSGIGGVRMPNGATPMTPADIAKFRQWILEGARNN